MGKTAKAGPRAEPPGVLYWLFRALLCLTIAPILGALIGIVGVVAGVFLGELAAVAVLVLFLADILVWMLRARRSRVVVAHPYAASWDPELDI